MMTVVAIMGRLLPILWSSGAGSEIMQRIAVPMIGGMVSTLLTLVVISAPLRTGQGLRIEERTRGKASPRSFIHLLDGPTGVDVGRHLARRQIPFVFVTGNLKRIPDDFAGGIGALEKPYSMNGLHNALTFVVAFLEGRDCCSIPAALVLSPATLSCLEGAVKCRPNAAHVLGCKSCSKVSRKLCSSTGLDSTFQFENGS
jgi:hypothetical protein